MLSDVINHWESLSRCFVEVKFVTAVKELFFDKVPSTILKLSTILKPIFLSLKLCGWRGLHFREGTCPWNLSARKLMQTLTPQTVILSQLVNSWLKIIQKYFENINGTKTKTCRSLTFILKVFAARAIWESLYHHQSLCYRHKGKCIASYCKNLWEKRIDLNWKVGAMIFLMWVGKKKWYIACIKSYVDGGVDGILYCAEANASISVLLA